VYVCVWMLDRSLVHGVPPPSVYSPGETGGGQIQKGWKNKKGKAEGVGCVLAIFSSGRTASVRPLVAYSLGGNLFPLTSAPGDHDGWEKVVACCSCCPIVGTHVGNRFASSAGIGRVGRPPPCPEDGLPVHRADFRVKEGILRPIGKALSHQTTVATPKLVLWQGRMVMSAHAGLPLTIVEPYKMNVDTLLIA